MKQNNVHSEVLYPFPNMCTLFICPVSPPSVNGIDNAEQPNKRSDFYMQLCHSMDSTPLNVNHIK
jgi:hypothetical protein